MKPNVIFLLVLFTLQLVNSSRSCHRIRDEEVEEARRPLQAGDIITPRDFLGIARRLREKAGKGIVSASQSSQTLADKLFNEFFFDDSRIIILKEVDMAGLDALQALALSGTEFNPDIHFLKLPKSQRRTMFQAKCQYALITRKMRDNDDARRVLPKANRLLSRLSKKRRLNVVTRKISNTRRQRLQRKIKRNGIAKQNDTQNFIKRRNLRLRRLRVQELTTNPPRQVSGDDDDIILGGRITPENKQCIWMYQCKHLSTMETCHVYPECGDNDTHFSIDNLPIYHLPDEHEDHIKQVRQMLGINIVDEEVAKILERRYMIMLPLSHVNILGRPGSNALVAYLDRLRTFQREEKSTTPMLKPHKKISRNHEPEYLEPKKSWISNSDNHDFQKQEESKNKKYLQRDYVTLPFKKK